MVLFGPALAAILIFTQFPSAAAQNIIILADNL